MRLCSGSPFVYSGGSEFNFYLSVLGIKNTSLPSVGALDTALCYLGFECSSV